MFKPKKYKSAAEKQRAWRIKHGQKPKVPIAMRRGELLGSSETTFREKKEDESWEDYAKYVNKSVQSARKRQEKASGAIERTQELGSLASERAKQQPGIPETYYERRRRWEKTKAPKKMRDTRIKEK